MFEPATSLITHGMHLTTTRCTTCMPSCTSRKSATLALPENHTLSCRLRPCRSTTRCGRPRPKWPASTSVWPHWMEVEREYRGVTCGCVRKSFRGFTVTLVCSPRVCLLGSRVLCFPVVFYNASCRVFLCARPCRALWLLRPRIWFRRDFNAFNGDKYLITYKYGRFTCGYFSHTLHYF